jgi:carbamate kinase
MKIVAALGGNALLRRGEPPEAQLQHQHIAEAAGRLAEVASAHDLILTHGNGPQVGLLALEAENYKDVKPYPLDVLGAESQGMVGYLLQTAIGNLLPSSHVATILTRVEVDPLDLAFEHPTKPIGSIYDEATAKRLSVEMGWSVAPDGQSWRRVVASPEPRSIIDIDAIRTLTDSGTVVIAAGGGGIPVVKEKGGIRGVEAVIDKDLTACLLARALHADMLLILTDVPAVAEGWGSPEQRFIHQISAAHARGLDLPSGSMGPKVEACIRFAEATGSTAAIGSIDEPMAIIDGRAGTHITASRSTTTFHHEASAARVDRLEAIAFD